MALRQLVEGDCGAANPLVQWSSHFSQQKPLAQGRVHHDRLREIARHGDAGQMEQQLVNEFLGEASPAVPQTFNMASLLSEIQQPHFSPTPLTQHTHHDSSMEEWVNEFAPPTSTSSASPLTHHPSQPQAAQDSSWAREFSEHLDEEAQQWSEQFAPTEDEKWAEEFQDQAESKGLAAVATEMADTVTDPEIQATQFMEFVRKLGKGETAEKGGEVKGQSTDSAWAEEFAGRDDGEIEDMGFWGQLEKEWQDLAKQHTHPWLDEFTQDQQPQEYQFQGENPLKDMADPLEEGRRRLREGDLPSAVLLFEAEVQKNPESIEGWELLGSTQANNEQEISAIAAMHRCLELDPSNLTAHLTLAVSYTNEAQQTQALDSLRNWLRHNPKYSSLVPMATPAAEASKPFTHSFMSTQEHGEVCDLFLRAAQLSPEKLDPDIQVCLGVLFNLSNEFDKAIDCFTAALQTRPDDAMLWNKLGATLANSNRSEEAVHAYRQALGHIPGFTRCRYNLGISCINLKAYRESVEHFLTALSHQKQARGPKQEVGGVSRMSEAIWTTLRLAVTFLDRSDLIPVLEERNLDTLLAEFGLAH